MKNSLVGTNSRKDLMTNLIQVRESLARYITRPVVRVLAKTGITPNAITVIGLLLSVGATALIITGHLVVAGILVLVSGLFDILDGALARQTNQTTRFGAIFDSTIDRIMESLLLLGLLVVFARESSLAGVILVGITMPSSLLVSYIRARAEAMGLECKVGIFTRAERVIILALGLLLSDIHYALFIALCAIALFSLLTVGQRLRHIWRLTKSE